MILIGVINMVKAIPLNTFFKVLNAMWTASHKILSLFIERRRLILDKKVLQNLSLGVASYGLGFNIFMESQKWFEAFSRRLKYTRNVVHEKIYLALFC